MTGDCLSISHLENRRSSSLLLFLYSSENFLLFSSIGNIYMYSCICKIQQIARVQINL